MGLIASYRMIDDAELADLIPDGDLPTGSLWAEGDPTDRSIDIDKYWDVLHLVLTGESASDPVEDNLLSEAIVGVENVDEDEDAEFVAVTHTLELAGIVAALRQVDLVAFAVDLVVTDQQRAEIYPEGVLDDGLLPLFPALTGHLQQLIDFYDRAAGLGRHVVVTIL